MKLVIDDDIFGRVISFVWVFEYQKRGMPHAHLLLGLCDEDRPKSADDYDRFCSAELPGEDQPILRRLVLQFHVHGPCGQFNPNTPCMRNGLCQFGFPKPFVKKTYEGEDGMPMIRRRKEQDGGHTCFI